MALIDPARRRISHGQRWDDSLMSPNFSEIERLVRVYGNLAIKLRPGVMAPDYLMEGELEFVGVGDDCLELTVWMGEIGKRNHITASELNSGSFLSMSGEDIQDTFGAVKEPGNYLYEPVKVLIRSHLFGLIANKMGLWQIDPQIAYLSGNECVTTPWLKKYKILKIMPFNLKTIKSIIKKYQIGWLEIKKRGLEMLPEKIRKELDPRGENHAVLVFTRIRGRKSALLVEPL
jgi:hypothetical protein